MYSSQITPKVGGRRELETKFMGWNENDLLQQMRKNGIGNVTVTIYASAK